MSKRTAEDFFQRTPSNLLSIPGRPIAISDDTHSTVLIDVPPSFGKSMGTYLTTPAESCCNNRKTQYIYNSQNTNTKVNLSQTCVKFGVLFNSGVVSVDCGNDTYPPWNFLGELIDSVTLSINGTIVASILQHYLKAFTSHILTTYARDAFETLPFVFHPAFSDADTYAVSTGAGTGSALSRRANYTANGLATKVHMMNVPLYDLLCMQKAPICINTLVKNIELVINFKPGNVANGIKLPGNAFNGTGVGYCVGSVMQVVSSVITLGQQSQIANEKENRQLSEILSFISPTVYVQSFNGSNNIIISSVKYLYGIALFSLSDTLDHDGDVVQAGGNIGQLVCTKRIANQLTNNFNAADGDGKSGFTNASISHGSNIVYPQSPLVLAEGGGATFSPKYNEYINQFLLSTHRLGDRADSLPMSAISMARTCQMLYIVPYSEQIHVETQVADLILRLQAANGAGYSTNLNIVVYTLKMFEIQPNGSVNEILR